MIIPTPLGFVAKGRGAPRTIVSYAKAAAAYAAADPGLRLEREAFTSAFAFPASFAGHVESQSGSTRDYVGVVGVPYLHFDLDRPSLDDALADARGLARDLADRYGPDAPLIHFSGSKGFHISIPTGGAIPPSEVAHAVARRVAESVAADAGVTIDTLIYDRVRLFRAPNSRHAKTGLHKIRLDREALETLDADGIRALAAAPVPYAHPAPGDPHPTLIADAADAAREVAAAAAESAARREHHHEAGPADARTPNLNPTTWDLILDPTSIVGRHSAIFSAAADLVERSGDDVDELVRLILSRPGLYTGLPPSEVRRQIACGVARGRGL